MGVGFEGVVVMFEGRVMGVGAGFMRGLWPRAASAIRRTSGRSKGLL